jgi:3-dehydrosphinganine reductase
MIGYTAYAPTKWAVRGLADCLRNELLKHNIQVSVAYPPDTKTPGFQKELETRPVEVQILTPETDAFSTQDVARQLVSEFRKGVYHIMSPDPLMNLLIMMKSGVAPRRNLFLETLIAPLIQIIAAGYLFWMDSVSKNPGTPPGKKKQ